MAISLHARNTHILLSHRPIYGARGPQFSAHFCAGFLSRCCFPFLHLRVRYTRIIKINKRGKYFMVFPFSDGGCHRHFVFALPTTVYSIRCELGNLRLSAKDTSCQNPPTLSCCLCNDAMVLYVLAKWQMDEREVEGERKTKTKNEKKNSLRFRIRWCERCSQFKMRNRNASMLTRMPLQIACSRIESLSTRRKCNCFYFY